jgi:NAD(P)H-nitrite reductase large subunit
VRRSRRGPVRRATSTIGCTPNIQKDGTFSGHSAHPRRRDERWPELRRIADVADKYRVPMVKITGSQRIDLLGIKKEDLPAVWADPRHARRARRTPRACAW